MSPFCAAVVKILKDKSINGGVDAYHLREALMDQGMGKHPAGVAMNLTKLAFKGEYITQYIHHNERVFMLTEKGKTS
jgi:hypothetical protein